MKFKHSQFNFEYKRNPNENVIYNTFSKALVIFDDEEYETYKSIDKLNEESPQYLAELAECEIIRTVDFDEIAYLKYFHYKTKFSNDCMFLTIAPTLDCNFACPYCYENRRKGIMSKQVQDAIIEYIEESANNGTRYFNITWYGGEPLLCFDIVESLSERISECCQEYDCLLKMELVTNGYLLTADMVEKLDSIGITKIQITLDGLKEHHDVRRPLRGGGGTFDIIVNNLKLFEDSPIGVLIRMNVDNKNAKDFAALKNIIADLDNSNIELYASPVENINKDTINTVSDFMTTNEFESFAIHSCEDGTLPCGDDSIMDDRYCFCTAETENCYVVDDRGDFYKCWDVVGRQEYRCFNILNREDTNFNEIAKFVADDPFSDKKCRHCVFLPLCFGGCKFQKNHLNKSVCGFTKDSIIDYIERKHFK